MSRKRLLMTVGGAALALAAQCASGHALPPVLGVVLESGNPGQMLSEGNTTLEAAYVECEIRDCFINMQIMSNIGNASCQHEWAIVGVVDNKSVDGGPSQESLPPSGITNTGMWQGTIEVVPGRHRLEFQLYVPCSVTANQWSVRYVLTPS